MIPTPEPPSLSSEDDKASHGGRAVSQSRAGRFFAEFGHAAIFGGLSFVLWWLFAWAIQEQPWVENALTWTIFSLLPAVVVTTLLLLRIRGRPIAAIGLAFNSGALRQTCAGAGIGAGMAVLITGVQYGAGWVEVEPATEQLRNTLGDFIWTPPFWSGLAILIVGSAGEELLFRGYGLQQLIRATNPWVAILGTSAVFGVMHGDNPDASLVGIVNTGLFGALFGFALVRQRSLWLPFGMHCGWNCLLATIGASVSGLKIRLAGVALVPRGPVLWSGGDYGPEASLLATVAVVAAGFVIWKMPVEDRNPPRLWD